MTSHTSFFAKKKKLTECGEVISGGSRDRALGGAECQRSTPISDLFSCYIEKYAYFVPFLGALGGMVAFGQLGSAFEGYGSSPPVNTYMCILEMQRFLQKPGPSPDRHRTKSRGPSIEPSQHLSAPHEARQSIHNTLWSFLPSPA